MKRLLCLSLVVALVLASAACSRRMAPFSPHRSNSEAHLQAQTNAECVECHALAELPPDHRDGEDCLRCHRILQGG